MNFWPIHCKHCGQDHWREGPCDRRGGSAGVREPRVPKPDKPREGAKVI